MGEPVGNIEKTGCERTGNRYFTLENGFVMEMDNSSKQLMAGDGICFFADGELRGTNINRVEGGRVYPDRCEGIAPGTEIYRNHDHAFVKALEGSRTKRRIAATASFAATPSRVEITFTDETGLSASVTREVASEPARDPAKMAATVREQLSKSGDTVFEVRGVELVGDPLFVPVSLLARMRREGLERLFEERGALPPERRPATEDMSARSPRTRPGADENVTNRLAESFWRDHGVTDIAPALEGRTAGPDDAVMRSRYCIRRETGECLKEGSGLSDELFLVRGTTRLRLDFDCAACEMVVKTTARAENNEVKTSNLKRKR
jgi:putative protease